MLKRQQYCQDNPKNFYTERKARHKSSGHSLSLICLFDETKNRHKVYRSKGCIEKFCEDLKELAIEIINYEEKEMTSLKNNEIKSYEKQKTCH